MIQETATNFSFIAQRQQPNAIAPQYQKLMADGRA
jgi:hypothetical protein